MKTSLLKPSSRLRRKAAVGQLKGELESTKTVLAENKSMLADMGAECKQKGMSFEEKQRMRTEEIEAIEKAIEIMSGDPSSSAEEHMSLAQQGASSLLQVARSFNKQSNSGRTLEADSLRALPSPFWHRRLGMSSSMPPSRRQWRRVPLQAPSPRAIPRRRRIPSRR